MQERRNEKLARKNPDRIQKQIDDIKGATTNGGKLSKHEEQMLSGLEQELKAVKKARDALGDKAPVLSKGWARDRDAGDGGVLGKRRRRGSDASSDEDTPEDVRRIPMPRDTPPPIPKELMDEWHAKRRARWAAQQQENEDRSGAPKRETPVVESKTVYEAKPMVRDLHKEAVTAFVPTAVRTKMAKGQGQAGLIEPEEADRLEKEGYLKTKEDTKTSSRTVTMEEVDDEEA